MKKRGKIVIFAFFLILFIPLIASAKTFIQNQEVDLKFSTNDSSCFVTIEWPNSTTLIFNQSTDSQTGFVNYTIAANLLSEYGIYNSYAGCSNSSLFQQFEVTPSGRAAPSIGEGIIYFSSIAAIFFFSFLLFLISGSFKEEVEFRKGMHGEEEVLSKGNPVLRFGFIGFSFIVAVIAIIYLQISLSEIFSGFPRIASTYYIFFWVSLFSVSIIFIFILISLIFQAVELFKIKKGKHPDRDAY